MAQNVFAFPAGAKDWQGVMLPDQPLRFAQLRVPQLELLGKAKGSELRQSVHPHDERGDRAQRRHRDGRGDERLLTAILTRENIDRLGRRHSGADRRLRRYRVGQVEVRSTDRGR